ncbi:uncharacterized protein BJX67DRAFT_282530 [Aspergillus lucknowensis]|uniref:Uncharacterized protein n=1 Tax=Aspergillus lucknowensis TaxID=176173 RepID=A0ABR4M2V7_9EURO
MLPSRSLASKKSTFIAPPEPKEELEREPQVQPAEKRRRRRANLYDAVAGRVNSHGFIPATPYSSKYRDTVSSSKRPLPPEEVLFRRKGMPIRYEETDRYFAHESLPPDRPLPSSELLESIHAYTADFFDRTTRGRGDAYHYSMSGTSLMFMGVLLEELAKESLGDTGDLVLVQGEELTTDDEDAPRCGRKKRCRRANSGTSDIYTSLGEELDTVVKRYKRSKKRRLTHRASTTDMDTEAEEKG